MKKSKKDYDFSGWATRNNIRCSDGKTIMKDAFKINDGQKVPLVWNHQHNDPNEVLGHALLENREDGVYAYCKFNNTEAGQVAKELVNNGDIDKLSIYANKLQTHQNNVMHGCIREVSIVIAGANPGAFIDTIISHSDGMDEEAIIYNDELIEILEHSDDKEEEDQKDMNKDKDNNNDKDTKNNSNKTVEEIFETLNEEQKEAMYVIIGQLLEENKKVKHSDIDDSEEDDEEDQNSENNEDSEDSDNNNKEDDANDKSNNSEEGENDESDNDDQEEEDNQMKHNVFNKDGKDEELKHSENIEAAIKDARRYGSMKESFIQHDAISNITDIDKLFPDAVNMDPEPRMIKEDESWVGQIMGKIRRTPFSRVKNTFGKMTEPEARAKGYIKGTKKVDIKMAVLNRVTTPTTVYIKNEIDRDDVIDITSFDVVKWQKSNMRSQLNKELARAMLLGDGRNVSDPNKINEQNIRPVISDDELFTIQYSIKEGLDYKQVGNSYSNNDSFTKGIVRAAIRARKQYKGSGHTTFYTTEDYLTDILLIEDQNGRTIYESIQKLCNAMRVDEIVTIPEMEAEAYSDIVGVIVNMSDYTAGADKGGEVNMFDDFDIDFNQMKYLMETRMSGALTVPYSAIVLKKEAAKEEEPTTPENGKEDENGDDEIQG